MKLYFKVYRIEDEMPQLTREVEDPKMSPVRKSSSHQDLIGGGSNCDLLTTGMHDKDQDKQLMMTCCTLPDDEEAPSSFALGCNTSLSSSTALDLLRKPAPPSSTAALASSPSKIPTPYFVETTYCSKSPLVVPAGGCVAAATTHHVSRSTLIATSDPAPSTATNQSSVVVKQSSRLNSEEVVSHRRRSTELHTPIPDIPNPPTIIESPPSSCFIQPQAISQKASASAHSDRMLLTMTSAITSHPQAGVVLPAKASCSINAASNVVSAPVGLSSSRAAQRPPKIAPQLSTCAASSTVSGPNCDPHPSLQLTKTRKRKKSLTLPSDDAITPSCAAKTSCGAAAQARLVAKTSVDESTTSGDATVLASLLTGGASRVPILMNSNSAATQSKMSQPVPPQVTSCFSNSTSCLLKAAAPSLSSAGVCSTVSEATAGVACSQLGSSPPFSSSPMLFNNGGLAGTNNRVTNACVTSLPPVESQTASRVMAASVNVLTPPFAPTHVADKPRQDHRRNSDAKVGKPSTATGGISNRKSFTAIASPSRPRKPATKCSTLQSSVPPPHSTTKTAQMPSRIAAKPESPGTSMISAPKSPALARAAVGVGHAPQQQQISTINQLPAIKPSLSIKPNVGIMPPIVSEISSGTGALPAPLPATVYTTTPQQPVFMSNALPAVVAKQPPQFGAATIVPPSVQPLVANSNLSPGNLALRAVAPHPQTRTVTPLNSYLVVFPDRKFAAQGSLQLLSTTTKGGGTATFSMRALGPAAGNVGTAAAWDLAPCNVVTASGPAGGSVAVTSVLPCGVGATGRPGAVVPCAAAAGATFATIATKQQHTAGAPVPTPPTQQPRMATGPPPPSPVFKRDSHITSGAKKQPMSSEFSAEMSSLALPQSPQPVGNHGGSRKRKQVSPVRVSMGKAIMPQPAKYSSSSQQLSASSVSLVCCTPQSVVVSSAVPINHSHATATTQAQQPHNNPAHSQPPVKQRKSTKGPRKPRSAACNNQATPVTKPKMGSLAAPSVGDEPAIKTSPTTSGSIPAVHLSTTITSHHTKSPKKSKIAPATQMELAAGSVQSFGGDSVASEPFSISAPPSISSRVGKGPAPVATSVIRSTVISHSVADVTSSAPCVLTAIKAPLSLPRHTSGCPLPPPATVQGQRGAENGDSVRRSISAVRALVSNPPSVSELSKLASVSSANSSGRTSVVPVSVSVNQSSLAAPGSSSSPTTFPKHSTSSSAVNRNEPFGSAAPPVPGASITKDKLILPVGSEPATAAASSSEPVECISEELTSSSSSSNSLSTSLSAVASSSPVVSYRQSGPSAATSPLSPMTPTTATAASLLEDLEKGICQAAASSVS